ncbi:hypothetical protein HDU97_004018 [Phlyctochytrium planicorne]|nr:hypothetical protein HDU97_004018 [Phlyctochytrium planicorne]
MPILSTIFTSAVGLEHFYILYLEMFQWNTKKVNKIFGLSEKFASQKESKGMAANQGLYNGFLAAGLIWSILHPNPDTGRQLGFFFNGCVAVAATYAGVTVTPRIIMIQGMPAFLALACLALKV